MTNLEMRAGKVSPNTPGANELVVKEGQDRNEAYREQCGHPTGSIETHRVHLAKERAFKKRFPELGNPFVADRYGDPYPSKPVGRTLQEQQEEPAK